MYAPEKSVAQADYNLVSVQEFPAAEAGFAPADGSFEVRGSGMNPEETRLALLASDIFLQAFDPRGQYTASFGMRAAAFLEHAVEAEGIEAVAKGFRHFRYTAGETNYQAMHIEASVAVEQTGLDEYLKLILQKKLIVNRWRDEHDITEHLAGGLLATEEVADALSKAAGLALRPGTNLSDQITIGNYIDFSISYVRRLWQEHDNAHTWHHALKRRLTDMFELSGVPLTAYEASGIADRQLQAIKSWRYAAERLDLPTPKTPIDV